MNLYKFMMVFSLVLSSNCFAGELVKDAEIIRIGNSSNGVTDDFFIMISGGTGPCAGQTLIFPRDKTPSAEFFSRLYSTALLAYSTGSKKVRVYNPVDNNCRQATYIDIQK